MIYYKDFNFNLTNIMMSGSGDSKFSNNIFTFDIETSTAFYIKGKWRPFFYSLSKEFYNDCKCVSWCYIWQFSIDEQVVYGRSLESFKVFLDKLLDIVGCKIYVYVHNLSYEFQFLRNILHFDKVFARKSLHPIFCQYGKCEFRCSYFLSRLSLDAISKDNVKYKKKTGAVNYNKLHFPWKELTDDDYEYSELDCLSLYEYIARMRNRWGNVKNIPYTQTGNARRAMQEVFKGDCEYNYYCRNRVPSLDEYLLLREVFWGGLTIASSDYVNYIVKNVHSFDETSCYPFAAITEDFPQGHFTSILRREIICESAQEVLNVLQNEVYNECAIFELEFTDLKSTHQIKYIPYSKVISCDNKLLANGRVVTADRLEITVTDVDLQAIMKVYSFSKCKIKNIYVSRKGRLNSKVIDLFIRLFCEKNELKFDDERKDEYAKLKEILNSLYGMMVTNNVIPDIIFNDAWDTEKNFDPQVKLDKERSNRKNFTIYAQGVWIAAYPRKYVFDMAYRMGDDWIYTDTDSAKVVGYKCFDYVQEYNDSVIKKLKEKLTPEQFEKVRFFNKNGDVEFIGQFSYEGTYDKFKTIGAKKYAYENKGKLHITVAGLSSSESIKQIHRIEDFKIGQIFDYKHSGRTQMLYLDDQEPIEIDGHVIDYKYSICAIPKTYTLGISKEYDDFLVQSEKKYDDCPYMANRRLYNEKENSK